MNLSKWIHPPADRGARWRKDNLPNRGKILAVGGALLMRYFYDKFRKGERASEGSGGQERFRYSGPKPQTKAAAILMLADGVEAAARTLSDHAPEKLKSLIGKIVAEANQEGQFTECDLTLLELDRISVGFLETLGSYYHGRIAYPGDGMGQGSVSADSSPTASLDSVPLPAVNRRQNEEPCDAQEARGKRGEDDPRLGNAQMVGIVREGKFRDEDRHREADSGQESSSGDMGHSDSPGQFPDPGFQCDPGKSRDADELSGYQPQQDPLRDAVRNDSAERRGIDGDPGVGQGEQRNDDQ
jgi:hypothetical protein